MSSANIFTDGFSRSPYWWDAYTPSMKVLDPLPASIENVIVGGGYAGISCARTLARAGQSVLVLESGGLGQGAASRSGGQVTGGVNVLAKAAAVGKWSSDDERKTIAEARLGDAASALRWFEDTLSDERIECGYHKTGRLTALWTPEHYGVWEKRVPDLNRLTDADARMLTANELSDELGSRIYHGAALIGRAGHLHPALLYKGLLDAAVAAGARVSASTPAMSVTRTADGYLVVTPRGRIKAGRVVIASNGYPSPAAKHISSSVVPVTSHMIATEPMDPALARSLIMKNRAVSETRRVVNHYRLSPDGRRLLFGGRARFVPTSEEKTAELLYGMMLKRFPQLRGTRITHSWGGNVAMTFDYMPHIGDADGLHWVFGCNGSGVVMMNWLGHMVARKIVERPSAPMCAYDSGELPSHPLYFGSPWFLFALGSWYQLRDAIDHRRGQRRRNAV